MSRFEELCAQLRKTRREFAEYRDICFAFMHEWMEGFRDYMDAPEGYCEYYATEGHWQGRKVAGLNVGMRMGDDGYFHVGIIVDLVEQLDTFPTEPNRFIIRVRKDVEGFHMLMENDMHFLLKSAALEDCLPMYEYIFTDIKDRYANSVADFLRTGDVTRRHGF
jgi:hypothetical protein